MDLSIVVHIFGLINQGVYSTDYQKFNPFTPLVSPS